MDRFLNVMTVFAIVLFLLVLVSVRRAHIRVEYSVSWLIAATVLLAFSRWPWLLERIAIGLGINDVPLALVLVTGSLFLIVLYRFSLMISNLKDENIALTQRLAILEFRLESDEQEFKKKEPQK